MREAARALDDVSDHLGEVLRRADELLAEWSRFGGQVRAQVEREAAAIGEVVDGAVARAAGAGLDRAVADRLQALTGELERLEQRARAASRAVAQHRDADRRVLWIVVAGIVLANALLVALLLRRPDAAPVAEPIRLEAPAALQPPPAGRAGGNAAAGSADPTSAASPGSATEVPEARAPAPGSGAGSNLPAAGANAAGANAAGANAAGASAAGKPPAKPTPPGNAAKPPAEGAGSANPGPSPVGTPKGGISRPHKKLP